MVLEIRGYPTRGFVGAHNSERIAAASNPHGSAYSIDLYIVIVENLMMDLANNRSDTLS